MATEIRIVHFNDVYHVPSVEQLSKFHQIMNDFRKAGSSGARTLTIFSGDVFSPSLEASVLKGEHMVPILNWLNLDVACYGNHDFDFGDDRLVELSRQTKFPWLLSNAYDIIPEVGTGSRRLLGEAEEYTVQVVDGIRIGMFGLAGSDWPEFCEDIQPSQIEDPSHVARRLATFLRSVEKCHLVIAITHMRLWEDLKVANATFSGDERVDLILGGHDHEVIRRFVGDTSTDATAIQQGFENAGILNDAKITSAEGRIRVIKSGTDWQGLSLIQLFLNRTKDGEAAVSTVKVQQHTDIKPDRLLEPELTPAVQEITEVLESIHKRVGSLVQQPVLHTNVALDGRGSFVRSRETNLGNMLADAVRAFYDTDIGLFNSGAIRCDCIFDATILASKPLLVRDIMIKRVTGAVILTALENSVSDLHADGRFLQLSGLRVVACWDKQPGRRILKASLDRETGKSDIIQPHLSYTIAMSRFIASGFDGFTQFPDQPTIVGEESGISDTRLLLEIFRVGSNEDGNTADNTHRVGIKRARQALIMGHNETDALPIVGPSLGDRILFVDS